jgi:HTH-type transcriptional regulator/antitoxin HigA
MRLKPIRSEIDYDAALKTIERYFNKPPKKGTAEADRFDVLATLIEAYERVRWPIPEADPVDVIRYRMETHGYTQADLARVLGSRARIRGHAGQAAALSVHDPPVGGVVGDSGGSTGWPA